MAEFKDQLTQREEPNINRTINAENFDKSNVYKQRIELMDGRGKLSEDYFQLNQNINEAQKKVVSNQLRINFDTFSKNEQQMMQNDPNAYYQNFAENQQKGKKMMEETFHQINNSGLFKKGEMSDLSVEFQGRYNDYFLQNNARYTSYQSGKAVTSTMSLVEKYKDLNAANVDDVMGVNRNLNFMEESIGGLADFLEPEEMLKYTMEFSNYRDTIASGRIENYLDNFASTLDKTLNREIANGTSLEKLAELRTTMIEEIKTTMIDPNFTLGTVTENNFDGVTTRKFINPVVNKAFDNASTQLIVDDVYNQMMSLIEKTGNTKDIEKHINDETLKNLTKIYKDGTITNEQVFKIKSQVMGRLDQSKASDEMKKYIGKGTPENVMKMNKVGAEMQFDGKKYGLSGYGNVGAEVSAAVQYEQALASEKAMSAARTVVRSRSGGSGGRRSSSSSNGSGVTINSSGQLVNMGANGGAVTGNRTSYKGNQYMPVQSGFTMMGATAMVSMLKSGGVINGTQGGSKASRKMYNQYNNVSKTWNEQGTKAIQTFFPQMQKDGLVTNTNYLAPLMASGGQVNIGTAKSALELSYTSFTNLATRDSNNNMAFTPKQMYYELVDRSMSQGKNSKRFTLFNDNSPEIQALKNGGFSASDGGGMNAIKSIHNYFNDPRMMDQEMSDIAIQDSMHLLGYNALVTKLATRNGGTNMIKDEQILSKVLEYQMSPEQLKEASENAKNVVGYNEENFKSFYNKSFTEYVSDNPDAAEFMRNFVNSVGKGDTENKEIMDGLNNVMKGYVLKKTMEGVPLEETGAKDFANEIMGSLLSDYHVVKDQDSKNTFFIDKENFDPKMEEYMTAYASSLEKDPEAHSSFVKNFQGMSDEDRNYQIGKYITSSMNSKLEENGMKHLINSAAPESLTVTTAEEAENFAMMLQRPVKVGDMLFTIKNADKNSNVPLFITQDEIMEKMSLDFTKNSVESVRIKEYYQNSMGLKNGNVSSGYGSLTPEMISYMKGGK